MLGDARQLEELALVDVVRWAGVAAVGLLVVGPASALALGATPASLGRERFLLTAFGPGVVAALASGAGVLALEAGDRCRAWPAVAAVVLAVLLPLAALAAGSGAASTP